MLAIRPSAAGKWVNCTASPGMEEGRPEGDKSAADEGTVAHWIAAKILRGEALPEIGTEWEVENDEVVPNLMDTDNPIIPFTTDMLRYVREYTNAVNTIADYETVAFVESPVDLSGLLKYENAQGTPDRYKLKDDTLIVQDFKYGFSPVEAANNLQLASYAWGIDTQYLHIFSHFYLEIYQPRIGNISRVHYTREEMAALWNRIELAAGNVKRNPVLNAGEHCHKHYCKAQAVCPAFAEYVLKDLPDAEGLSNADIGEKLSKIAAIRKWCDAIEAEAYILAAEKGERITGYKLVAGRGGIRQWRDEAEAETTLKAMRLKSDQMYSYKVISPTQAEKLLKDGVLSEKRWGKLKDLITRTDGKPQLVPESDKRPEITIDNDLDLL